MAGLLLHLSLPKEVSDYAWETPEGVANQHPRLSLKCRPARDNVWDNVRWNQPEGTLKPSLLGPTPESLAQQVWGRAPECAFLTQSWVMLVLLGGGAPL